MEEFPVACAAGVSWSNIVQIVLRRAKTVRLFSSRMNPKAPACTSYRGAWALVTGASSGLGREIAQQLAALDINLVLVGRNTERLEETKTACCSRSAVRIECVSLDLAEPMAAWRLKNHLKGKGIVPRILINNAATIFWGNYEKGPLKTYEEMVHTQITSVIELCHLFYADLKSQPPGQLVNICSRAAELPNPYTSVYGAGKAFLYSFSLSLREEWRSHGIQVSLFLPGVIKTPLHDKAGLTPGMLKGLPCCTAKEAAENLVRRMFEGRAVIRFCSGNFLERAVCSLMPREILLKIIGKRFRPRISASVVFNEATGTARNIRQDE